MEGYELSETAVRKLAEIVRAYNAGKLTVRQAPPARTRRDMPYTPAVYRLATNAGDGAYTLRKQEWDADAEEMIDVPDQYDPDYNLDIDGFDYRGRADGVAGAAGTGQIVRGWKIWHVDDWITLVDVGDESVFPITLTQTGGAAVADDTTQANWTYTVTDARSGQSLGTAVNPTAGNHKWVRPTVGYMTAATAGMAYRNAAGALVILWINEVADGAACG